MVNSKLAGRVATTKERRIIPSVPLGEMKGKKTCLEGSEEPNRTTLSSATSTWFFQNFIDAFLGVMEPGCWKACYHVHNVAIGP